MRRSISPLDLDTCTKEMALKWDAAQSISLKIWLASVSNLNVRSWVKLLETAKVFTPVRCVR